MFDFLPHQILEIIRWKMEIFAETRRETDRGRENPYIETFRFKIFRISAIFIHSTTNGYRHLMTFARAFCRPIEGEKIPTYKNSLL